jgi:hypothetical protein
MGTNTPKIALALAACALLAPAASAQAPAPPHCAATGSIGNVLVSVTAVGLCAVDANGVATVSAQRLIRAEILVIGGRRWSGDVTPTPDGNGVQLAMTEKITLHHEGLYRASVTLDPQPGTTSGGGASAAPSGCTASNPNGEITVQGAGLVCRKAGVDRPALRALLTDASSGAAKLTADCDDNDPKRHHPTCTVTATEPGSSAAIVLLPAVQ